MRGLKPNCWLVLMFAAVAAVACYSSRNIENTQKVGIGNVTGHRRRRMNGNRMANSERSIDWLISLSICLAAAILAPEFDSGSVSTITSFLLQDMPRPLDTHIHAFSRFGRRLKTVRNLFVMPIFAHISRPPGPIISTPPVRFGNGQSRKLSLLCDSRAIQ